jgi:hypothetical protein
MKCHFRYSDIKLKCHYGGTQDVNRTEMRCGKVNITKTEMLLHDFMLNGLRGRVGGRLASLGAPFHLSS